MRISVITISFNNKEGLQKTIESVKRQSYRDVEYIVIDGGSQDGSREMLDSYNDDIDYWVSEKDRGIYHAMNKGVAVAQGDYCIFLNSGDVFWDDSVLVDMVSSLDADVVCGNAYVDGLNGYTWIAPDSVDDLFWKQRFSICQQAVLVRTSLLKDRPFNETLRIVGDYEWFAYQFLVRKCSYLHLDRVICKYGADGISSDHERSDQEKIRVLEDFRRQGVIENDELLELVKRLKPGTRRYELALKVISFLVKK